MLGTPNFGSTNAIETLFSGNSLMATVDKLSKENGMADVVRSLPGVYNLLPAPEEFFPTGRDYPVQWDLYNAKSWQIPAIQQKHLDSARRFYGSLSKSDPQVPIVEIAGCHMETLVGMQGGLDSQQKVVLKPQRVEEGENSGDGTVPLWSARLPGADLFYIQEKHADLPNNRQVIQAALDLVNDGQPDLPTVLPEPKTSFLGLSFEAPGDDSAADLGDKIRAGTATQEDLKKLYFAQ
jgi:hypothetical protein